MSGRRWAAILGTVLAGGPLVLGAVAAPVAAGAPSFTRFSGNWAGYAATGKTFTSISGSWIEPKVTCSGSDLYAPWVGIDGYSDSTVEQTGVATQCSGGKATAAGWYEMYPTAPVYWSNPVSLGDHFTASVVYKGSGTYALTLKDVTKAWSHTVTKRLSGAHNASAEAVIEGPGGYPTIPSGVTFTNVLVNGANLSTFRPNKLTSSGWVPGTLSGGTFTIKHT